MLATFSHGCEKSSTPVNLFTLVCEHREGRHAVRIAPCGGLDPDVQDSRAAIVAWATGPREVRSGIARRASATGRRPCSLAFPDGASEPHCDGCAVEMRAEAEADESVRAPSRLPYELRASRTC